ATTTEVNGTAVAPAGRLETTVGAGAAVFAEAIAGRSGVAVLLQHECDFMPEPWHRPAILRQQARSSGVSFVSGYRHAIAGLRKVTSTSTTATGCRTTIGRLTGSIIPPLRRPRWQRESQAGY